MLVSTAALALAFWGQTPPTDQRGVYTRPTISGNTVIFTCEGDLWRGDLTSREAARLTRDAGLETSARFSPDGKRVAFTAQYDGTTQVYVMPSGGGEPLRLTYEPAVDGVMGWSPEGDRVIFRVGSADPQNLSQVRSIPAGGGLSQLVPVPRADFASFNANGDLAYVPVSNEWANWFHYEGGAADQIWLRTKDGAFRALTRTKTIETTPVWCGGQLYGVSERTGTLNLFRYPLSGGNPTPITRNTQYPVRYPDSDGQRIVFQSGPFLSLFDPVANETKPLSFRLTSDRLFARERQVPLTRALESGRVGPTAKRIVVASRGQIVTVPAESGAMRTLVNQPGSRAMLPAWSPNGASIAYFSDVTGEYELYTVAADGSGTPKQITKGFAGNPFELTWSPDGSKILVSDRELRVRQVTVETGAIEQIWQGKFSGSYDIGPAQLRYSPDGQLVCFNAFTPSWASAVMVANVATKEVALAGEDGYSSTGGAFSPDGKFLVVGMDRDFTNRTWVNVTQKLSFDPSFRLTIFPLVADATNPFPTKNDEEPAKPAAAEPTSKDDSKPAPKLTYVLTDLARRGMDVPGPTGRYTGAIAWLDGQILVSEQLAPLGGVGGNRLMSLDLEEREWSPAYGDHRSFEISGDGKSILFSVDGGFELAPIRPGPLRAEDVPLGGLMVSVKPTAEWRHILRETWRANRDLFYDPGMHGVDWNAVWTKYEAQLDQVGDRSDLDRIQREMVSELRCGHAYIGRPPLDVPGALPQPQGFLGIDVSPAAVGVRIDRILRGPGLTYPDASPLADPTLQVKEGDFLVSINGQPIPSNRDYRSLLLNQAGKTVLVGINSSASLTGARTVAVTALGSEWGVRVADYVRGRRDYVNKVTGGKFGYVYVSDMSELGSTQWAALTMSELEKEAVVFDFRANGGGNTSSVFLDQLVMRPLFFFQPRMGGAWRRESWAFRGSFAALCNEYNFSDGELVIESWKKLGLGPVVGKRTGGGEVGSGGGYRLIDGSAVYVPNYAAFDFERQEWIIEGVGATPTVEVDQDPAKALAGADPQLDRAIALLQDAAKRRPVKPVTPPKFPRPRVGG